MQPQGTSLIGFEEVAGSASPFTGVNPATGELLQPTYHSTSLVDLSRAVDLADTAFQTFRNLSGKERGAFMRKIAEKIESVGDVLAEVTVAETGLPEPRIRMETGRACFQLRLFAEVIEEGSWVDARLDSPNPDRAPVPKPDVRSMLRPLGPVAVFGASNFPIAISVAGNDTVAAFAAGCTVVAKAHPAHPATDELMGRAINEAIRECGLPEGTFSLVHDAGIEVGKELVHHPKIKAVGFTGSLRAGRALTDIAARRPEPIPVYAEMGSVNPIFVLPGVFEERGEAFAEGLFGSVTLGVGQFCTSPGVVIGAANDAFKSKLTELMQGANAAPMLHKGIREAFDSGIAALKDKPGVTPLVADKVEQGETGCMAKPVVVETTAKDFLADTSLAEEVFGPSAVIVHSGESQELLDIAKSLEGQLTVTIHGTEADLAANKELIEILETKTGRLLFNQFPTGVEVCHAMVHGGPYPAASDAGRGTSIGTMAMLRYTRPVCFQNFPESALPPELQKENPLGLLRLIDGERKKA